MHSREEKDEASASLRIKMKKINIVYLFLVLAAVSGAVRTQRWWQHETAKGHYLTVSGIQAWGFCTLQYQSEAMCPRGHNCNTLGEIHQFGPIQDDYVHPPCFKDHPACSWDHVPGK